MDPWPYFVRHVRGQVLTFRKIGRNDTIRMASLNIFRFLNINQFKVINSLERSSWMEISQQSI
jgi:hypothetical protein